MLYESFGYPHMAFNNTYGLALVTQEVYDQTLDIITRPGGVQDQILTCRSQGAEGDPLELGNNATVNEACVNATNLAYTEIQGVFASSNVCT